MNCRPSSSIYQLCNAGNWTSFRKFYWAENVKHLTMHKHVVSITNGLWQGKRKLLWPVPRREINCSNCAIITKGPKHAVYTISPIYMEVQVLIKDKAVRAITYLPRCEHVWRPGDTSSRILNIGNGRRGVVRCMAQRKIELGI